ncbi:MAG: DNA cytosine methyltransferase [Sutterellaceae bacterium]|nr:DNA cytosine methyltransferase [Sutterellaceae bacterium]
MTKLSVGRTGLCPLLSCSESWLFSSANKSQYLSSSLPFFLMVCDIISHTKLTLIPKKMSKNLLSVSEIAERKGVTAQWVRQQIRNGVLRATRVGKNWVVTESDFDSFNHNIEARGLFESVSPKDLTEKRDFVALSFFSGAMGLDLGLEKAGIQFRLACENDKTCQQTIRLNRQNMGLIGDIWNYSAQQIKEIADIKGDIDLIVGGPPCQAFSTAGARKGFDDQRGNVFLHYIDLLLELKPKYIVIENVRGLLSAPLKHCPWENRQGDWKPDFLEKPGGALLYIIEQLRAGGYSVSFNLYNAANFGVPQIRERVVIICSRDGRKVPYLMPTNSNDPKFGLAPWETLRQAIDGVQGCDHTDFPEKRLKYFRMLHEGQYWKNLPEDIQPEAMGKSFLLGGGKTGFYRRLAWDKPSCTLVTSPTMPATDICHPTEDRPLSIQEYKRIQMFPDDWTLAGNIVKQYKQVGNAVPVGLGYAIGKAILAHARGESVEPPADFPFSRYKNTDDVSWEANTRRVMGLEPDENLLDHADVDSVTQRMHKKEN